MHKFLPFLLLLTACASDPLELHIAPVKGTSISDDLTAITLPNVGPLTDTTTLLPAHEDLHLIFLSALKQAPGPNSFSRGSMLLISLLWRWLAQNLTSRQQ